MFGKSYSLRNRVVYNYLLFAVWPFLALLITLRGSSDWTNKRNLIWFFCGFFGYSFIVLGDSADITRYVEHFHELVTEIKQGLTLKSQILRIYNYSNYTEPFNPILTYILAYFTNDSRLLLLSYGLVFGYFYSHNILYVISNFLNSPGGIKQSAAYFFILICFLLIPVWEINGIRMWTAASAYLYFYIRYFITYKRKYLIYFLLVPQFFHSSFLIFGTLTFFAMVFSQMIFFRRFQTVAFLLYIVFFVLSNIGYKLEIVEFDLGFSSSALQSKIDSYNKDEEFFNELESEGGPRSWFLNIADISKSYLFVLVNLEFIFLTFIVIRNRITQEHLIVMFIGILASLLSLHPSPSASRFLILHKYTVVLFLLHYLCKIESSWFNFKIIRNKPMFLVLNFLLWFGLVIEIRHGFDAFNYALFLGNPFTIYFFGNETPLIEFYHAIFGKFAG